MVILTKENDRKPVGTQLAANRLFVLRRFEKFDEDSLQRLDAGGYVGLGFLHPG